MRVLTSQIRRLSRFIDLLTIFLSFYVTYALTQWIRGYTLFTFDGRVYVETLTVIMASGIMALFFFMDYPTRRLTTLWSEARAVLRVNAILVFLFATLSFVLKIDNFSRMFIGTYFFVDVALLVSNRGLIRAVLGIRRRAGWDKKSRLIIGCEPLAELYLQRVEQFPQLGIRILGYIADQQRIHSMPHLGSLNDLRRILSAQQVDGVVITLPLTDPRFESVLDECELHGIPVELALSNLSTKLAYSQIVDSMGIPRLMLSQNSQSPDAVMLKRVTDFILSGFALLLLSPLFFVVAVSIKLDDGGPILFTQTRVGQFGRTFRIHKFRSMRVDAEKARDKLLHLNEMSGPVFKISHDPRITRVGLWLRKFSLDELPQLYDVFVGNMSLVGPRPPLPSEVKQYDVQHRRRLSVKPGITCLWQISGRNQIDFEQWMDLDLAYIDNWSYREDMKILLKTIPVVFKGTGAS